MSSGSSILPAIPKHEQIRVAMCVVGELGQTEFRSKIDNLILPNKRNADMHMFLVLQTRESNARCKVVPASLKDAVAKFSKHVPTTVTEYKYEPYYVDIDKWPGFPEIRDEKKRILQNHMNQYRSWQICAKMIAKQELKTRMKYHAVLRIQDNALVLQPLNILDRLQLLSQQVRSPTAPSMYGHGRLGLMDLPVITKACSSWSGVNDEVFHHPYALRTSLRRHNNHCCTDSTWFVLPVTQQKTPPLSIYLSVCLSVCLSPPPFPCPLP